MKRVKVFAAFLILMIISVTIFSITAYADTVEEVADNAIEITDISQTEVSSENDTEDGQQGSIMGVLFIAGILIVLWGIAFFSKKTQDTPQEPAVIESIPEANIQKTIVEEIPQEIEQEIEGTDEEELIAVITAAISAITKKPASGFRVTSFKKRGNWQTGSGVY